MNTKNPDLVIAKFDYKAADSHELGIYKGERLTLLDDTQHWWRVMNALGRIGYVPSNYVKRSKQGIFSSLRNTLRHRKSRHENTGNSGSGSISARPSKASSPAPDEETTETAPNCHTQLHTPVSNGNVTLPTVSGRHYAGSVDTIGVAPLPPLSNTTSATPTQSLQAQRWDQKGSSSGDIGAPFTASLPSSAIRSAVQQQPSRLPQQHGLDYPPAYEDNPAWNNHSPALASAKHNAAWLINNGEQPSPFPKAQPMHIKQNGLHQHQHHQYPEEPGQLMFTGQQQQYTATVPPPPELGGLLAASRQSPHLRHQQVCSALFSYSASQPDELSITRGDRIAVLEQSSDGWWRGVLLTTGDDSGRPAASGWFPSNYVTTADLTALPADSGGALAHPGGLNCTGMVTRLPAEVSTTVLTQQQQQYQHHRFVAPTRGNNTGVSSARERVLTLYPFVRNQEEEMSFAANEVLEVVDKPPDDPEWWRCRNATGLIGLVPRNYVRLLSPSPTVSTNYHRPPAVAYQQQAQSQQIQLQRQSPQVRESPVQQEQHNHQRRRLQFALQSKGARTNVDRLWYWGAISRAECEAMLAQYSTPGEFVIRDSESHPGDLTVTINAGSRARNFKVHFERGEYHIGQKMFPSLDDLIEHYRHHPIFKSDQEKHYLTRPFVYRDDYPMGGGGGTGSLGKTVQQLADFSLVSTAPTATGNANSYTLSSRCG